MSLETLQGLVIGATDFSETSRVVTLWTRELGKVRALAKGGRRLRSNFESALDLLSLCSIVLLRKSSGGLDLLTEARVQERFPLLRRDLAALYASMYVAELLGEATQEHDPHPALYDEALDLLRSLGKPGVEVGPRLAHFELVLWHELGYGLAMDACADCGAPLGEVGLAFSAARGGLVCPQCQPAHADRRNVSAAAVQAFRQLRASGDAWRQLQALPVRAEVRQVLSHYASYRLNRRPKLMPYLGS